MKKNLLLLLLASIITFSLMAQQFENASFENWEDAGTVIDEPVNWSSIKTSNSGDFINNAAPVVWGMSDDAHTGNHSIELTNVPTIASIIATGTISNGRVHAEINTELSYVFTDTLDDRWNTPLTGRPDSVAIWVKYLRQGVDTARCQILLHKGYGTIPVKSATEANRIAYAQIDVTETIDTWTRIAVPFTYYSDENPEYILSILTSGAGLIPTAGSVAKYDDIELIYNPSGIGDVAKIKGLIYSSDNTIYLDKLPQDYMNNATIEILNLNGALVYSATVSSNAVHINNSNITEGLYLVRVYSRDTDYTEKIFLK